MARLIAFLILANCSAGLQYIPAETVSEPRWRDVTPAGVVVQTPLPSTAKDSATIAVLPAKLVDIPEKMAVPDLFDDYVLTAVQNAGEFRVIGLSDIDTMLGLERQKELLGCEHAACMANLGDDLGVDYVVAIGVTRIEDEWVVTTKLIDIRAAHVEARTSDFVTGGVSQLLASLPVLITKLLGAGGL